MGRHKDDLQQKLGDISSLRNDEVPGVRRETVSPTRRRTAGVAGDRRIAGAGACICSPKLAPRLTFNVSRQTCACLATSKLSEGEVEALPKLHIQSRQLRIEKSWKFGAAIC
jgi:hypothetical protein